MAERTAVLPDLVEQAIGDFVRCIADSPQFQKWEGAFPGVMTPSHHARLQKLSDAYRDLQSVSEYQDAENDFRTLCERSNDIIRMAAGIDVFASSSCSCCG